MLVTKGCVSADHVCNIGCDRVSCHTILSLSHQPGSRAGFSSIGALDQNLDGHIAPN